MTHTHGYLPVTTIEPGIEPGAFAAWYFTNRGSDFNDHITVGMVMDVDHTAGAAVVELLACANLDQDWTYTTVSTCLVPLTELVPMAKAPKAAAKHFDLRIAKLVMHMGWCCANADANTPQAMADFTSTGHRLTYKRDMAAREAELWLEGTDMDFEKDWRVRGLRAQLRKKGHIA